MGGRNDHRSNSYRELCPGSTCTGVNAKSLKWLEIDEAGLLSGSVGAGTWTANKAMAQNNSWTPAIPHALW
ncbi:hypothetical protein AB1N83_004932 [Pleurotus pulmonarius]